MRLLSTTLISMSCVHQATFACLCQNPSISRAKKTTFSLYSAGQMHRNVGNQLHQGNEQLVYSRPVVETFNGAARTAQRSVLVHTSQSSALYLGEQQCSMILLTRIGRITEEGVHCPSPMQPEDQQPSTEPNGLWRLVALFLRAEQFFFQCCFIVSVCCFQYFSFQCCVCKQSCRSFLNVVSL